MDDSIELNMYVVQNSTGDWFRSTQYAREYIWTKDLNKAKIYLKLRSARARVTAFTTAFPNLPIPVIVEFIAKPVQILNETERISKFKERKRMKMIQDIAKQKTMAIKRAEEDYERAKKTLEIALNKGNI